MAGYQSPYTGAQIDAALAKAETALQAEDVVNALDSTSTAAPLSAAQGKALNDAKLAITDIDDTPVDGETAAPISSNWAWDHAAATQAHGISAFGATLVDDTSASAALTTLGAAADTLDNITLARPSIRPSLLLDFANAKTLDPRITFTRDAVGTYYDGKTVAKAEENLLTYSQEFDNGVWVKSNVTVTANATTAPDGTSSAEKLIELSTDARHGVSKRFYSVSGNACTWSVYAKKAERSWLIIDAYTQGFAFTWFDLENGTSGTNADGNIPTIVSVGNGWYRCSVTRTAISTVEHYIGLYAASADNTSSYLGDGTSGIYLWGAQVEQRSSVTAYTPTTSQPITNYIPVLQSAAANVARFDHDPITGESKGLLIEEQRTNLLTYSEAFSNATWTKINATVTTNFVVAPDGTLTADKLIENNSSGVEHYTEQTVGTNTNQSYTQTVYVKAGETLGFTLVVVAVGASSVTSACNFVVSGGVITPTTLNGLASSSSAVPVGNGWYRCSVIYTLNGTVTSHRMRIYPKVEGTYTGDGTSGIYIWGAQLEAGAFPTSYIKTEAAQVTRAADAASMTGTNFSSWYRQDEGTIYTESSVPFLSSGNNNQANFSIGASSSYNDAIVLFTKQSTNYRAVATNIGGVTKFFSALSPATANSITKQSFSYKASTSMAFVDSGTVSSPIVNDTSLSLNYTRAVFGTYPDMLGSALNGHVKKVAYYPKRLSNAELVALTA